MTTTPMKPGQPKKENYEDPTKNGSHQDSDKIAAIENNLAQKKMNNNTVPLSDDDDFHYEFGGPVGTFMTMMALPVIVMLLVHWCRVGHLDFSGLSVVVIKEWRSSSPTQLWIRAWQVLCPAGTSEAFSTSSSANTTTTTTTTTTTSMTTTMMMMMTTTTTTIGGMLTRCSVVLAGWMAWQIFLERFLPAELVEGAPLYGDPNQPRLTYRINGHLALWVTLGVLYAGYPVWHAPSQSVQFTSFPMEWVYDYTAPLAFCTMIFCGLFSLYLYLSSFGYLDYYCFTTPGPTPRALAKPGTSGHAVYDFFMGRELNPRTGSLDWKEFCELRPGLMGWMIINLSCLHQQQRHLGYVTGSMLLINIFQGLYVWDALYQERAILTTMDITTDGFGFMLVFGDLAWVPFTYSVPAQFLVRHDPHLSGPALAAIVALHMLGYCIFRGANGQKDAFRRDPQDPAVRHLQYLQTKRGTQLLTSGWWGMARKINYTGDYVMGLTWCLLCGTNSLVPYYYAVYFAILLLHRSMRDDQACQLKYGADWDEYKRQVPYRFIPGLF